MDFEPLDSQREHVLLECRRILFAGRADVARQHVGVVQVHAHVLDVGRRPVEHAQPVEVGPRLFEEFAAHGGPLSQRRDCTRCNFEVVHNARCGGALDERVGKLGDEVVTREQVGSSAGGRGHGRGWRRSRRRRGRRGTGGSSQRRKIEEDGSVGVS